MILTFEALSFVVYKFKHGISVEFAGVGLAVFFAGFCRSSKQDFNNKGRMLKGGQFFNQVVVVVLCPDEIYQLMNIFTFVIVYRKGEVAVDFLITQLLQASTSLYQIE